MDGIPSYLTPLIIKLATGDVHPWDTVLVLSIIRLYRLFQSPVKVNYDSIVQPLKEESKEYILALHKEIQDNHRSLLKGLIFKGSTLGGDIKPLMAKLDHTFYFSPGLLQIGGWLLRGAIGKGPARILLELALLNQDPKILTSMDDFIFHFRLILKSSIGIHLRERGISTPSALLN